MHRMSIRSVAVGLLTSAHATLLTNQYPSPFTEEKTGLPDVLGRTMAPKGVCILFPGNWGYIMVQGKGVKVATGIRLLSS